MKKRKNNIEKIHIQHIFLSFLSFYTFLAVSHLYITFFLVNLSLDLTYFKTLFNKKYICDINI